MTEFVPGGGDDELTIPPDTFAEDDAFTTWPLGFSIMKSTATETAGTFANDWGEKVIIVTYRAGTDGIQYLYALESSSSPYIRQWDNGASAWGNLYGLVWDYQLAALDARVTDLESA